MNSKTYNNIKLASSIGKGIASFIFITYFVLSGLSRELLALLTDYSTNNYLLFLLFVGVTGIAAGIIFFPLNYYTGFHLEHKYNLSNQTFLAWIWEDLKGLLISLVIGIPILLAFYWLLNRFGANWWLPMAILLFVLSVLLARIVPVFILPLFYKITPLEDEDLKSRINKLAADAGIKVQNVFKFNMSKNTKKANAAFTGIGKSKRILLGDTLLDNYSKDEIETVLAHELGHYKKKHIIKNIIIGTVSSFLTLFLIAFFYDKSVSWLHFAGRIDISALPLLSLWTMVIGLLLTPIGNIISRKYEYEADDYAVTSTGKPADFIATLEKLNDQNLGDQDPHPFVEWYFYSHPSILKRIAAINK
jgi:STE24 endopeptidase